MEPEDDGLVQMTFLFRGPYSQVPAVNLPGFTKFDYIN